MTHFTVFAALRDSNVEEVTLNGKYTKNTILVCLNQILLCIVGKWKFSILHTNPKVIFRHAQISFHYHMIS